MPRLLKTVNGMENLASIKLSQIYAAKNTVKSCIEAALD